MKLLVTGGAGFIGSHYVRSLLTGRYGPAGAVSVTVIDRLTYAGRRDNLPAAGSRLEFVEGDICDRELLFDLLPGHDAVVHFAAESHVDRSVVAAAEFVRTNVLGTQTLLDAALHAGIQRIVHVSTDEVYDSIEQGSWTEDRLLLPNSPYAASKASSDLVARSYWCTHALDISITRCSNNYGPYQHTEKLIPRFITNLLMGIPVPVYGDGRNVREWLHVDDHCRAIHLVLTQGRAGEVYNVGSGNELTNLALTSRLLEICGADDSMIRYVADRKGHDLRYSIDDTKIREELGYAPHTAFGESLSETVEWYRNNVDWCGRGGSYVTLDSVLERGPDEAEMATQPLWRVMVAELRDRRLSVGPESTATAAPWRGTSEARGSGTSLCACRKVRPRRSSGSMVLVEDAAEAVASLDLDVVESRGRGDHLGEYTEGCGTVE